MAMAKWATDPAFDVGFAMTHLLSKAHHLPEHRETFVEAARNFWQRYHTQIVGVDDADALEQRSVHHTLGCLLARVAGRSPLEYLDDETQDRQARAVLSILKSTPSSMLDAIDRFVQEL